MYILFLEKMSKNRTKFYVVWQGRNPGIYKSWIECKSQVDGFEGAKYKSFESQEEAIEAYRSDFKTFIYKKKEPEKNPIFTYNQQGKIIENAICVDASCLGNPGKMEYRGVDYQTRTEIFRKGIFEDATVNIGEFLAIVHGLSYLKQHNLNKIIYTDSNTAIAWVKKKKAATKLELTEKNKMAFEWVEKAENWLRKNDITTPIVKWETDKWGEIPADFGRK